MINHHKITSNIMIIDSDVEEWSTSFTPSWLPKKNSTPSNIYQNHSRTVNHSFITGKISYFSLACKETFFYIDYVKWRRLNEREREREEMRKNYNSLFSLYSHVSCAFYFTFAFISLFSSSSQSFFYNKMLFQGMGNYLNFIIF